MDGNSSGRMHLARASWEAEVNVHLWDVVSKQGRFDPAAANYKTKESS